MNEWPIADLARAAGVTSRTLRHYDSVGLLRPSRVAENGHRFYGDAEVARLYRILSLRALDLSLPDIDRVLEDEQSFPDTVRAHLAALERTRSGLDQRISAVRDTLTALEEGRDMNIDDALAGVDDSRYEDEVRERWGDDAWERSAARRRALTPDQRRADDDRGRELNAALRDAAEAGSLPEDPALQALVGTHHRWVADQWGRTPDAASYVGLGELYVADARFAAVYGGERHAAVIRDAMTVYADTHLR
jgi:DNA-binding transcriptional MerR regulator